MEHSLVRSIRSFTSVSWVAKNPWVHSLVHWYQQFATVHHVPKCKSYQKAILLITRGTSRFHDWIYITTILFLWDFCVSWITYDYLSYTLSLACWAFMIHWCHQYVAVHHVPKCMSYNKAIVVITGGVQCFHDCTYITPMFLLL